MTTEDQPPAGTLPPETGRRRTFAIISHPDAGKTTMTEKLLLFGGAIQLAGTVRARKAARHATSDWIKLEQERGISVSTSVMQFVYGDHVVNLLVPDGDFVEAGQPLGNAAPRPTGTVGPRARNRSTSSSGVSGSCSRVRPPGYAP